MTGVIMALRDPDRHRRGAKVRVFHRCAAYGRMRFRTAERALAVPACAGGTRPLMISRVPSPQRQRRPGAAVPHRESTEAPTGKTRAAPAVCDARMAHEVISSARARAAAATARRIRRPQAQPIDGSCRKAPPIAERGRAPARRLPRESARAHAPGIRGPPRASFSGRHINYDHSARHRHAGPHSGAARHSRRQAARARSSSSGGGLRVVRTSGPACVEHAPVTRGPHIILSARSRRHRAGAPGKRHLSSTARSHKVPRSNGPCAARSIARP